MEQERSLAEQPDGPTGPGAPAPADPRSDAPADPRSDAPADPRSTVELIADQRARVAAAVDVDPRLLFGLWGVVWLVGFGAVWLAEARPGLGLRLGAGYAVFGVLMAVGLVVTATHVIRRGAGVRGTSAVQGAMYGWSWTLGFVVVVALNSGLVRADATPEIMRLVTTVVPVLVVGLLYMAGGAIWRERVQFALGVWILVSAAAGAVVGGTGTVAVMALAGGGGVLVAAVVAGLRR